jgi:hypothetical protein
MDSVNTPFTSESEGRREKRVREARISDCAQSAPVIAAFLQDLTLVITAAASGDFAQRMSADYIDLDLSFAAANVNDMLSSTDKSIAEFNRAMMTLAAGDTSAEIRGEHRGAFGQLQRNLNLATATLRTVLGNGGANMFRENAANFTRMLGHFRSRWRRTLISVPDKDSRPVASPARALRQKLARAFGGVGN